MTLELENQSNMNNGADFWYYEIGVNVIPVNSKLKNEKDPEKKRGFCKVAWTQI